MSRVAVIGWDCVPPALVFERWRNVLPNLQALMARGCWGELRSCHPPITVPAWAVMTTGKDPGELGLYGFRNRRDYGYGAYAIANSASVGEEAVWDVAGRHGKRSIVLGVPPSYPPRAVEGVLVSCFLTPSTAGCFTYPSELGEEIQRVAEGYAFDVAEFRDVAPAELLSSVAEGTRKRFRVAKHLLRTRPWDLFMMVEIGPDRIHHGLWRFIDPTHPAYEPDGPLERGVRQYYVDLDAELGELLEIVGDDTAVLVVSDHGATKLEGTVRFNDWLISTGYLRLQQGPVEVTPLAATMVDWRRTRAWGDGGYYGRLFLNVKGREPDGCVEPGDYERVRDDLVAEIEAMDHGAAAYRPEDLYRAVRGVPPDLLVYFGDLKWRSLGSVGWAQVCAADEVGADGANHDWNGIFVMRSPAAKSVGGHVLGLQLTDVAPTILAALKVPIPADMCGRAVTREMGEPIH